MSCAVAIYRICSTAVFAQSIPKVVNVFSVAAENADSSKLLKN